ncbi:MAG: Rieske (2Fe-2S) protein [Chloroflexota bacterium]
MKYVVASADEIPPGNRKIVTIAGRSIGIFNVGGEYFALRNRCPHQGGALCEGTLWGALKADVPGVFEYDSSREILTCPWHGWEFHVRTGRSWCDPRRLRVRRFDVTVETYPVSTEGAHLLVDLPQRQQERSKDDLEGRSADPMDESRQTAQRAAGNAGGTLGH